jgi:hypothetical protein
VHVDQRWIGVCPVWRVHAAVIDRLHPGGEQGVELGQVVQFAAGADLDKELLAHGPEEAFDLASSCGLPGLGVDQSDPQRCAGAQQLPVDHRRPVVQVERVRDAPRGQAGAQRRLESNGVLAAGPPIAGQQPGMIVEEGEQDRLAAVDRRTVQRIPGPPLVGRVGLESAERLGWHAVGAGVEFPAHEVSLQGAFVGRPPAVRAQDRCHLHRGTGRHLLLQRDRELEYLGRGARGDPARVGHQRVEPAAAPVADPPVDRGPRDAHRLPERAHMLTRDEVTDKPAALLGGQLRVGGLADQRVPEQPDRAGSFGPDLFLLVMAGGHGRLLALDVGNGHESRGLLINQPRPRAGSC